MFRCFYFKFIRSSGLKVEIQHVILLDDATHGRVSKFHHAGGSLPSKTL